MRDKLSIILMIGLFCTFGALSSALALSYSYTTTSTDYGPGAGFTYDLSYGLVSESTYSATLTITPSIPSTAWYAGWFLFNFGGSTLPSSISESSGDKWAVFDGITDVSILGGGGKYGSLKSGNSGYFGFYLASLATDTPTPTTDGISLASPQSTFSFDFTMPAGSFPKTDSIPFQVGLYADKTGKNGGFQAVQLSNTLAAPVPEPSTIMLLGSGLVSLGLWGRRKFKGKD